MFKRNTNIKDILIPKHLCVHETNGKVVGLRTNHIPNNNNWHLFFNYNKENGYFYGRNLTRFNGKPKYKSFYNFLKNIDIPSVRYKHKNTFYVKIYKQHVDLGEFFDKF